MSRSSLLLLLRGASVSLAQTNRASETLAPRKNWPHFTPPPHPSRPLGASGFRLGRPHLAFRFRGAVRLRGPPRPQQLDESLGGGTELVVPAVDDAQGAHQMAPAQAD